MRKFYVYLHRKADTGEVFYVGKGKTPADGDWNRRYKSKFGRSEFWRRTVEKHGFVAEIVFESDSEEETYLKELELVAAYGRRDLGRGPLVNLNDGGSGGGSNPSEYTRELLAASKRGKKASPETRRRLSEAHCGRPPCSDEVRKKISQARRGCRWEEASREKMSKSRKGDCISQEHRKKISDGNRGRRWSAERKARAEQLRVARKAAGENVGAKVAVYDSDTGRIYPSGAAAAMALGVTNGEVSRRVLGKRRHASNLHKVNDPELTKTKCLVTVEFPADNLLHFEAPPPQVAA